MWITWFKCYYWNQAAISGEYKCFCYMGAIPILLLGSKASPKATSNYGQTDP